MSFYVFFDLFPFEKFSKDDESRSHPTKVRDKRAATLATGMKDGDATVLVYVQF